MSVIGWVVDFVENIRGGGGYEKSDVGSGEAGINLCVYHRDKRKVFFLKQAFESPLTL